MVFSGLLRKKLIISWAFVVRRLHSLTGLAFTLFLCEHLLTNSLASSLIGNGKYFVWLVDGFHKVPGLKFIEIFLLAVPFGFHAILGIKLALEAKFNALRGGCHKPYCKFERNYAYSWQRLTAWFLLIGILLHVVHMRFLEYPKTISVYDKQYYLVTVKNSAYSRNIVDNLSWAGLISSSEILFKGDFREEVLIGLTSAPQWQPLVGKILSQDKLVIVTASSGQAFLVIVKESFSSVMMAILYSLLVLIAVYHGFNGLWSFMVRWGIVISQVNQIRMLRIAVLLMVGVSFLGLFAIWSTYWSVK